MLGAMTTLMMHYPVTSMLDAFFFILKGYRLDRLPRRSEVRDSLRSARNVTTYLLSDVFMRVVWVLVWLIVKLRKNKPGSSAA